MRLGLSFPTCDRGGRLTRLSQGNLEDVLPAPGEVVLPWEERAGLGLLMWADG